MRLQAKHFFIPGLALLFLSCSKNLTEVFFHPSVDERANESLSGTLPVPTPIPLGDPNQFNFAVFADVHQLQQQNNTLLPRFEQDIASNQISFFVVLGDLTEDGLVNEFKTVKTTLDSVGIPYYTTVGNHDLFQDPSQAGWGTYKSTFGPATYSVTLANAVRFIFLDTASGDIGQVQFQWLKNQLTTQVPFTFVGSHYPIYDGISPIMWRLSSVDERYELMSLLEQNNVYAYLAGHIHGYRETHLNQIHHFTVGSMYPYGLDYGVHGYLLFSFDHGQMSYQHITF